MKRTIDSKYEIVVRPKSLDLGPGFGEIVIRNVFNGNVIPEDEPLFLFRSKDKLSLGSLLKYFCDCVLDGCTKEQLDNLYTTILNYAKWQLDNPDKMKQPGCTMPADLAKFHGANSLAEYNPDKDKSIK